MTWINEHILTLTIFAPLLGVFALLLLPRRHDAASREIGLVATLLNLAIAIWLGCVYNHAPGAEAFRLQAAIPWIPELDIFYRIGIDGVSLLLIQLTALLTPLCVLSAWRDIKVQRKEFMIFVLLSQLGLTGAFAALDLFLFYIFWEVMLIPMYFLVGIWGGKQRLMAAGKFLLYTMVGSVLMLVAILYLYVAGGKTFNLVDLYNIRLGTSVQLWLFAAFALAFAIKVPLFPVHTWLPDAHTEAPTVGSVLLAGVFLKVGTYGFYRFAMPLFPDAVAAATPLFLALSVIGILAGALVSMVQPDIKRIIAYSSVSHLGFVMLGLFAATPEAVQGAVLQMLNHGISTGALFLLFGMLYERTHRREITYYGGIAKRIPVFTVCFVLATMSSIGVPGLNNFVGEFLILLGTFRMSTTHAVLSASGVIFAAVYLLWLVERVFFGRQSDSTDPAVNVSAIKLPDLSAREVWAVVPLLILMVWLGVAPQRLLSCTAESVARFVQLTQRTIVAQTPAMSGVVARSLTTTESVAE